MELAGFLMIGTGALFLWSATTGHSITTIFKNFAHPPTTSATTSKAKS
jgi:hypothetical protein